MCLPSTQLLRLHTSTYLLNIFESVFAICASVDESILPCDMCVCGTETFECVLEIFEFVFAICLITQASHVYLLTTHI